MARTSKPLRSDISWSSSEKITIRGLDMPTEILGHMDIGELSFLQITGQRPTKDQARVYNAMIVALIEHGLTPSAIAARLTYTGAPESMQAAIAAGICGLGTVFVGSMEGAAKMLTDALPFDTPQEVELTKLAERIVADFRDTGKIIPGLGHPIHKQIDPRAPRLLEIARETRTSGRYVELVQLIAAEAARVSGKPLPLNATGVIGALCCELQFPWQVVRGFGVMARAIGLVGHLAEERVKPIAPEIWRRTEEEATQHVRPD